MSNVVVSLPLAVVARVGRAAAVVWAVAVSAARRPNACLCLSELAAGASVSVPAAWKHARTLEEAGLLHLRRISTGRVVELLPLRPDWLPAGVPEALDAALDAAEVSHAAA